MKNKSYKAEETQELSLQIDNYDDIFSDFDIRPYSLRAISVDFLDELRRATRGDDRSGVMVSLHIPQNERSEEVEDTIKERLKKHFERHYSLLLHEKRSVLWFGLGMVILGVVCMILATLVAFQGSKNDLMLSFLLIFLEPAAWFLLWEGMDQVIFNSKKINPELGFYKRMLNSSEHIYFKPRGGLNS